MKFDLLRHGRAGALWAGTLCCFSAAAAFMACGIPANGRASGAMAVARGGPLFRNSLPLPRVLDSCLVAVVQAPKGELRVEQGEDDLGAFWNVGRVADGEKAGVWVELRGARQQVASTADYLQDHREGLRVLWELPEQEKPVSGLNDRIEALRPRAIQEYERGKLNGWAWRLPTERDRGVALHFLEGRIAPDTGNIGDAPERPEDSVAKKLRRGAEDHREAAKRLLTAAAKQGLLEQN